mmetsp:Transcript_29947/g.77543  ORF Transcript_29947/g.77543 Transcript_29947/m.77543 type:complete len:188 (+) Transcript_29947:101-664(+)
MVLLEHVGFGGRDRQVWLYWWDARDGQEWSGWWITPDFIGNNDFFLHHRGDPQTPADAPLGSWRSPFVEEQQIKRQLEIGFQSIEGSDGNLRVCGADASTPFIPDGVCRVRLGNMEFRPDGMNHGKPAYQAYEVSQGIAIAPAGGGVSKDARQAATTQSWSASHHPAVYIAAGVIVGIACTVAIMRR